MSEQTSTYYWSGGQRRFLSRRDDLLAVKLKGVDSRDSATRSAGGTDLPDLMPAAPEEIWPGGMMVMRRLPGVARSAGEQSAQIEALRQRDDVQFASPVFENGIGAQWVATDEIAVQYGAALSEFDLYALHDYHGLEVVEAIEWLPRGYLLRLTPAARLDALGTANALVEEGHAAFAHPNFMRKYVHRGGFLEPVPGREASFWHLAAIDAFGAWRLTSGDPGITVAVIDGGIDVDHAAFACQAAHFSAVDRSDNPRPPSRHDRHGTACAGLAVGLANPGAATSGVAPGCRLMAVRLLDQDGPLANAQAEALPLPREEVWAVQRALSVVQPYREALAIQWAASHGADVISNSWGPLDRTGQPQPIDDVTRLAVDYAAEKGRGGKGCVICWAAGNGNESISLDGYASNPAVLAVGACTPEGKRAPYSDYGPELALCAPGGGYSQGLLTTAAVDPEAHAAYRADFNGTSAATPLVAGVAALVLSRQPGLSREEVYDVLRSSAEPIDNEGGQYVEGHSPFYGRGRVNARRAVEEAARRGG